MNGMQRLARAERDAVALHQALTDLVKRIHEFNRKFHPSEPIPTLEAMDLLRRTAAVREEPAEPVDG